jgi:hypothetical protein
LNIFYAAVEDDPLDSGGRVIEGASCGTVKGEDGKHRKLTFLGQQAWCDKCKTAGIIVAAPGSPDKKRFYDRQRGRQRALGGDLVLCKCERHPRIVSVYGRKCKIRGDSASARSLTSAAPPARAAAMATTYDERFVLRDANGRALSYTGYALRRETGTFEYGKTDSHGYTHLLASVASAESINVYFAG